MRLLSASLLVLLLLLAGCDLFEGEEDTTIRAFGTVVLEGTGEPIENLGVAIVAVPPSFGGAVAVAETRTDAEGHFDLRYEVPQSPGASVGYSYSVRINDVPYDGRYATAGGYTEPGETIDFGVVELSRIED